LKRHELLRDLTSFGLLWAAGFGADLAGAPESIKYVIAVLWSVAVVIGGTAYFGWDRLYARRSFLKVSILGVFAIGILLYTGFLMDNLALNTWQWFAVSGVLVVTWANLFELLLLFLSAVMYYWSIKIGGIIDREWKQIRQEEVEKTALRAAEQLLRLIERSKQSQDKS
jgi:hypothetical protein